jgi:hypothetical protein
MPSLARNLAEGTGGSGGGNYGLPTALHAISVDADGMLTYTKSLYAGSGGTETIDVNYNLPQDDSTFFTLFENYIDDYNDTTGKALATTRYEQWYHGSKDVYYYIDDDGYFCMRTNRAYTYTGPK